MVLASSPRSVADKLQRVLNAAARLVSGTRKYDRGLSQILHADLHWLDVADRVQYELGITVHRCLHNKAPQYVVDCCVPVSDIASHQRLRSARHCLLTIPRHRCSTLSHRAFSVAGPTVWNLLPDQLRDSNCTESAFRQSLKTLFFKYKYRPKNRDKAMKLKKYIARQSCAMVPRWRFLATVTEDILLQPVLAFCSALEVSILCTI